jgi:hypothetical protein
VYFRYTDNSGEAKTRTLAGADSEKIFVSIEVGGISPGSSNHKGKLWFAALTRLVL